MLAMMMAEAMVADADMTEEIIDVISPSYKAGSMFDLMMISKLSIETGECEYEFDAWILWYAN